MFIIHTSILPLKRRLLASYSGNKPEGGRGGAIGEMLYAWVTGCRSGRGLLPWQLHAGEPCQKGGGNVTNNEALEYTTLRMGNAEALTVPAAADRRGDCY